MAASGATRLELLSRSGTNSNTMLPCVHHSACDVSSAHALMTAVTAMHQGPTGRFGGCAHVAGVRGEQLPASEIDVQQFEAVLKPKVNGVLELHVNTSHLQQPYFLIFSSVASVFGLKSGAAYSASNGYMDSFTIFRRAAGMVATAVQWGAWTEIGMASDGSAASSSYVAGGVTNTIARWSLLIVHSSLASHTLIASISWENFLQNYDAIPDFLSPFKSRLTPKTMVSAPAISLPDRAAIVELILHAASQHMLEPVGVSDNIVEAGMDSLVALDFRQSLMQEIGLGLKLPGNIVLQCPTPSEMADFILTQLRDNLAISGLSGAEMLLKADAIDVGVAGMSCCLANGIKSPNSLWQTLWGELTCITADGPGRWQQAVKRNSAPPQLRTGAFITMDSHFESSVWGIGPSEAMQLDEHLRWMLTVSKASIDDTLRGVDTTNHLKFGTFTAAQTSDFIVHLAPYMVARTVASKLSLNGECCHFEAVCSSGYLAVHHALQHVQQSHCDGALATGISLMLKPDWGIACFLQGIFSMESIMRPVR